MSTERIPRYAGFVSPSKLPKGPNGLPLCRWCKTRECATSRNTFCSPECVHEHKIRTQPSYAKQLVYDRDHGVCAECGVDTCADLKGPVVQPTRLFGTVSGSRWDMDHIIPVCEGGGDCGLENYRTLCKPCHKRETAALARRRAEKRKTEKC